MRYLTPLVLIVTLCGCSLVCDLVPKWCHEPDPPNPTPKYTPTPTPIDSTPQKIMVDGHAELRIGSQRVAAVGRYELLIDAATFNREAILSEFRTLKQGGVNLVRIWVLAHFKSSDLSPWKIINGKYDLSQLDPNYFARMDMIASVGDETGICIAWTVFDGWSLRWRPVDWSVNPQNHIDTQPRQWEQENYSCQSVFPLSRSMWSCRVKDNKEGNPCTGGLEGFNSQVQWLLIRNVSAIASNHKDIIYLWSEMFPDERHRTWDITAMRYWTQAAISHVHECYPGALIGTSVDRWQSDVYELVDIADCHGLTRINPDLRECDPSLISSSITYLRNKYPNTIFCSNSDGCMGSPRFEASWVADVLRRSWQSGAFAEFKMDSTSQTGIFQGIQAARVKYP